MATISPDGTSKLTSCSTSSGLPSAAEKNFQTPAKEIAVRSTADGTDGLSVGASSPLTSGIFAALVIGATASIDRADGRKLGSEGLFCDLSKRFVIAREY